MGRNAGEITRYALPVGWIAAGQDGWTWQNPLPQGNNLNGVWCSSSDIYAVGVGDALGR